MKIFKYLRDDNAPINEIIFMTALSGLANALILAVINVSADMVANHEIQSQYFVLYLIIFLLYAYTQKYALTRTIVAVEQFTNKVRLRIASKIRQVELSYIENTERGNIYTRLTQDSNLISQSTLLLISAAQSMMVLIFSFIYLIFISPISFFMTLAFLTIAILTYIYYESGIMRQLRVTGQKEAKFFSYFSHLLDGFKEVRINRAKSDDLFHNIEKLSQETETLRMDVGARQVNTLMFARLSFYVLLAILVFIVPLFHASHAEEIYKISTTVLFIIGPISLVISALPSAAKSNLALDNLYELESELDKVIADKTFNQALVPFSDFATIQLDKNHFAYRDSQGKASFSIGPIDLTINKGDLLFIVGGNGSGKSTLLKLLVGLYQPDEGHLLLDNNFIEKINTHAIVNYFP
ncbi:MAG: ATP-binding cassette domain-containing protein [Thiofilum sp.]|nr:ATP-binding cassette domain-containing protein [Thiofilum sp.]MBK8452747.1 ATP-binding cassette domain-containing protein [Thiofilum sp.]